MTKLNSINSVNLTPEQIKELRSVFVIPKFICDDNRYMDLINAINTYLKYKIKPNKEWIEEAIELSKTVKSSITEKLPIPDCFISQIEESNSTKTKTHLTSAVDILIDAGIKLQLNKAYSASEEIFKSIIQRFPDSYSTWFHLGNLYKELGKLKEAEECYRKNPDYLGPIEKYSRCVETSNGGILGKITD